jgi:hypothetical protein
VTVVEATASGTGRAIGSGALIGALCGALLGVIVATASPLPSIVLGSFTGVIGGYLVAAWRARTTTGPGATLVLAVLTNRHLLTFRHRPAVRVHPLRSFPLAEVSSVDSDPTFVGRYRKTDILLIDGSTIRPLTVGPADLARTHREQTPGNAVD